MLCYCLYVGVLFLYCFFFKQKTAYEMRISDWSAYVCSSDLDKNIAALASDGLYRTDHHLAIEQGRAKPGRDPQEVVAAHVRRLEALRRAGIVERVAEGLWKVPDDLAEQGRRYDAQRLGGVAVELKSHLPIERQARVTGATWLDPQLIGGCSGLGDQGFGSEAKQAMQQDRKSNSLNSSH